MSGTYANATGVAGKYKLTSVGFAYDLGVAKPSFNYAEGKYNDRKQTIYTVAVTVPLGQGALMASFTDAKANGAAEAATAGSARIGDAKLFAAGYVYNLSKRTALYTTVSQIKNDGAARFAVAGSPTVAAGAKSSGFDVGVRHSF